MGYYLGKFIFDRVASLLGLIVLSPILLISAIAVMVDFGTLNPIFRQKRVGKDARLFTIYKFRTMQKGSTCSVAVSNDTHISRLGQFMRHCKLDELPELFNVLIGDMSLVGPRPDVPGYADRLEGEARVILKLRPGITGPASLKYAREDDMLTQVDDPQRYNDEVIYPDKVRINIDYYYNHSFIGDMKIILVSVLHRF